jgi:DNA invertase Pin-like site-specific DNA recombinase
MSEEVFWGIYVRESTEGQIDGVEYNGLDSQESVCRKWVAGQGPSARVYGVYSDVESGTSFRGRDGLKRLLHDAQQGEIQGVVAYELDRWARNLHDYGTLKKQFAAVGVPLRSASVRFDDSAEGKLMESQLAGFAEYFSDLVSRKVKTKRAEMAAKGMFLGGGIPFGYTKEAGKIVVVDAEAATVRLIFDLFERERSAARVRHQLRARGIKNRAGNDWNNTNIAHILKNRFYIGELSNEQKAYRGSQEPLIASELFDAVQAMQPVKRRTESKMDRPYPLVDVLRCGHCGTRLSTHYVDRGKCKVPYYRCTQTFKKRHGAPAQSSRSTQTKSKRRSWRC